MGQRFYIKSLLNQYTNLGTKSGHFTWVTSGLWDVSNFERVIKARDPHQTFRSLLVPLYTVSIGRDCARICHYATQLPNSSLESFRCLMWQRWHWMWPAWTASSVYLSYLNNYRILAMNSEGDKKHV